MVGGGEKPNIAQRLTGQGDKLSRAETETIVWRVNFIKN